MPPDIPIEPESKVMHTEINVDDPDGFYAKLIELHEGLSVDESLKVNAKLILMMANEIGDRSTLDEMLAYLRDESRK